VQILAVSPDPNEKSQELAERLRAVVDATAAVRLRAATATFPDQGLVLDALLDSASDDLRLGASGKTETEPRREPEDPGSALAAGEA